MMKINGFKVSDISKDPESISPIGLIFITSIIDNILKPISDQLGSRVKIVSFHKVVNEKEIYNTVEIKAGTFKSPILGRRVTNLEIVKCLVKNGIYDQLELIGGTKLDPGSIRVSHKSVLSNKKEMLFTDENGKTKVIVRQERDNFLLIK